MFIYVTYSDSIKQKTCFPLVHPELAGIYVIVPWDKKRPDGIPTYAYSVFHHESGAVISHGDTPEKAIEEALTAVRDQADGVLAKHIADTLETKKRLTRLREEQIELAMRRIPTIPSRTGAVYLIRSAGRYKIGQSLNPEQRIAGMTLSEKPEILVVHWTEKWKEAERELHLRFAHKRGHGEWFDFSEEELQEIEKAIREF